MDQRASHDSPNRDRITVGNITNTIGVAIGAGAKSIVTIFSGQEQARNRRDELILLDRVRQFWIHGVLDQSVHDAAPLELGKHRLSDAVSHPWEIIIETEIDELHAVPPGTKMFDIFQEMGRSLLILGNPGSGKTITLLEVARDGIIRAEEDPTQPIPVILNLSSWPARRQAIDEWLLAELNSKYYVPKKIGRVWIERDELLLLLDGLDEVAAGYQHACIEAINHFRSEHGLASIVVCSRVAEYQALPIRLNLGGAILLEPLRSQQVQEYLAALGPQVAGLQVALEQDEPLHELAKSPLLLSVMSLAYQDVPAEALAVSQDDSIESRRQHIFGYYIERMLKRRSRSTSYDPGYIVYWLSWLASNLAVHQQSIFLIEQLQPSWLQTGYQRWVYSIISRTSIGLIIGMATASAGGWPSILTGMVCGALIGFTTGAVYDRYSVGATGAKAHTMVRPGMTIYAIITGLCAGIIAIAVYILLNRPETTEDIFLTIIGAGLVYGVFFSFLFSGRSNIQDMTREVSPIEELTWSWRTFARVLLSAFRKVFLATFLGLIVFMIANLTISLLITHHIDLDSSEIIQTPITALVGILFLGFGSAIVFAPVLAAFAAFHANVAKVRTRPNQGTKSSARNAFRMGVSTWLVFGLVLPLIGRGLDNLAVIVGSQVPAENPWKYDPLIDVLPGSLYFWLSIGIMAGLWFGGFAWIQHYTLRAILWRSGHIPWDYALFLNTAVRLIFLQQVGGGYIFIHRLLLEYFASLYQPPPASHRRSLAAGQLARAARPPAE